MEMRSDSGLMDERKAPRTGLFLSALLHAGGTTVPIRIRNLSSDGALVESAPALPVGTQVRLQRATENAFCTVRWVDGERIGLKFNEPILICQWVPSATAQRQMVLDKKIAELRKVVAVPEAPLGRLDLRPRIAEELCLAMRSITTSLDELATFSPLIARHPTALQELEVTSQILGHLAAILRSPDPAGVIASLGMDDLKRRLTRT